MGKLSLRSVMLALGKKNPWEDWSNKKLSDFNQMFQLELTDTKVPTPASSSSSSNSNAKAIASVPLFQDISAPAWSLMHEHGFAVGKHYTIKNQSGIFELKSIDDTSLSFLEHIVDGRSNQHTVEIPTSDGLNSVFNYKGALPAGLPLEVCEFMAHSSAFAADERNRCEAFMGLIDAASAMSASNDAKLFFTIKPNEVIAQAPFKKRALKLVPCTDSMSKIQRASAEWTGPTIALRGDSYSIAPPATPKNAKLDDWSSKALVSAYWWVIGTAEEGEANMEKQQLKVASGEVDVWTNSRALKVGDKLCFHDEGGADGSSFATKKRRKA